MKGKVIEPDPNPKEEDELGIGLECPNCEEDMRKVTTADIAINLTGGETHIEQRDSRTAFICDACGYREEVERS